MPVSLPEINYSATLRLCSGLCCGGRDLIAQRTQLLLGCGQGCLAKTGYRQDGIVAIAELLKELPDILDAGLLQSINGAGGESQVGDRALRGALKLFLGLLLLDIGLADGELLTETAIPGGICNFGRGLRVAGLPEGDVCTPRPNGVSTLFGP